VSWMATRYSAMLYSHNSLYSVLWDDNKLYTIINYIYRVLRFHVKLRTSIWGHYAAPQRACVSNNKYTRFYHERRTNKLGEIVSYICKANIYMVISVSTPIKTDPLFVITIQSIDILLLVLPKFRLPEFYGHSFHHHRTVPLQAVPRLRS